MKQILFLVIISLSGNKIFAQSELHCATDRVMREFYNNHPDVKLKKQTQDAILKEKNISAHKTGYKRSSSNGLATYTIPIVFHILHSGGPENISDAQVKDAVRILNEDYAGTNPDISEVIPSQLANADSSRIQFVLATRDPDGNCTNGINHYFDANTDWHDDSPDIYAQTWNPTMYLNVYVVKTITLAGGFGAAGYTYYPGSWTTGDNHDAIVLLNNYFGSIGTGHRFLSRVLTHEAGHWLNLAHVWGSTNSAGVDCSDDDYVSDTPQTMGFLSCPDANDPASYQICSPGTDENFQNYMDYSYCCRMFTHGQGLRMQDALNFTDGGRNNLWTTSNLIATGVLNPSSPCVPVADFRSNRIKACAGTPVIFADASTNSHPTTYTWSFPGGNPGVSYDSMPVVTYNTVGTYSVTYTSATTAGAAAPVTKNNYLTITSASAVYQGIWSEGFENSTLPDTNWSVESSSGGSQWIQTSDAAYSGTYSAELPSANNTRMVVTSLTGPAIDISSVSNPELTFQLATQQQASNHIDRLQVLASLNCGQTWEELYSKNGAALATAGVSNAPFIPSSQNDWRLESIDLSAISQSTAVIFKFVYTRDTISGGTNNLYIDDINIQIGTGIKDDVAESLNLSIYPNPSKGDATVAFTLNEKSKINITIRDILGRIVETVVNTELQKGDNSFGFGKKNPFEPGIYFVNFTQNENRITQKIIIE